MIIRQFKSADKIVDFFSDDFLHTFSNKKSFEVDWFFY